MSENKLDKYMRHVHIIANDFGLSFQEASLRHEEEALRKQAGDVEPILRELFKKHNLVLVDVNEYGGKRFKVPKGRVVSYKWVANKLRKKWGCSDAKK